MHGQLPFGVVTSRRRLLQRRMYCGCRQSSARQGGGCHDGLVSVVEGVRVVVLKLIVRHCVSTFARLGSRALPFRAMRIDGLVALASDFLSGAAWPDRRCVDCLLTSRCPLDRVLSRRLCMSSRRFAEVRAGASLQHISSIQIQLQQICFLPVSQIHSNSLCRRFL